MIGLITGATIFVLVLFVLVGIRIVRPTQKGLVERLGKYKYHVGAGFHWIVPLIDQMILVNITERMMDVDPQDIITKDNLNAEVDLVVYYQVKSDEKSLKKSRYDVDDFEEQIVSLAQTTARNVIGDMAFKDVNGKRNELNRELAKVLDKESDAWGVRVVRVEMKEIKPPKDVQESMNRVIKAENLKDAAKDEAEATETKADGVKRATIKEAEGVAKSKMIVADAIAYKIKAENLAAQKYFKGNAKELKRLEVTLGSLENNTKVVLTEKGIKPQIILGNIPTTKE